MRDPQDQHLGWLLYTPSSDGNFKNALDSADLITLRRAAGMLKQRPQTKTAVTVIERRIRKLEKQKDLNHAQTE